MKNKFIAIAAIAFAPTFALAQGGGGGGGGGGGAAGGAAGGAGAAAGAGAGTTGAPGTANGGAATGAGATNGGAGVGTVNPALPGSTTVNQSGGDVTSDTNHAVVPPQGAGTPIQGQSQLPGSDTTQKGTSGQVNPTTRDTSRAGASDTAKSTMGGNGQGTSLDTSRSSSSSSSSSSSTSPADTGASSSSSAGTSPSSSSSSGVSSSTSGSDTGTVNSSSAGSIAPESHARRHLGNMGLSSDQVKQLQQALNDAGCQAGAVDGVLGPKTRHAIACVRKEKNISGQSLDDVLSALNLGFTTSSSSSSSSSSPSMNNGTSSDTSSSSATSGMSNDTSHVRGSHRQTGGMNHGRIRPTADSTGARSSSGAWKHHGMKDSTAAGSTSTSGDTSHTQH